MGLAADSMGALCISIVMTENEGGSVGLGRAQPLSLRTISTISRTEESLKYDGG